MSTKITDFSQLADLLKQNPAKPALADALGVRAPAIKPKPTAGPAQPAPAPKAKKKKESYVPRISNELVFKACHTFTCINGLADSLGDVIEQTHFYTREQKVIAKRVASDCMKLQELKFSEVLNNNVATASYVLTEQNYLDIQDWLPRLSSFEQGVLKQIILAVFFNTEEVSTLDIKKLVSLAEQQNKKATGQAALLDRLENLKKARAAKAAKKRKL